MENKDNFKTVEEDNIIIFDESDDYVPGESVPGEIDDEDLDIDYCEKYSTEVKRTDPKTDNIISVCVIVGCLALIIFFILYAFGRFVW